LIKVLLDTHVLLPRFRVEPLRLSSRTRQTLLEARTETWVSVASLWEIAIKWRAGKLPLKVTPRELPVLVETLGLRLLPVLPVHATSELDVEVETRDPFDRILLAQAQVETMRFVTWDGALADHPLALT
jgi:PIN domain nuclease of toxin-antitoxin system